MAFFEEFGSVLVLMGRVLLTLPHLSEYLRSFNISILRIVHNKSANNDISIDFSCCSTSSLDAISPSRVDQGNNSACRVMSLEVSTSGPLEINIDDAFFII